MNTRPLIPINYADSWKSRIVQQTNANNLLAGYGIKIVQTSAGSRVDLDMGSLHNKADLHFRGTYDTTAAYKINDVVYVDPLLTYVQNGVTLTFDSNESGSQAPICGGLFVCNYPISCANMSSSYLINITYPYIQSKGGKVTLAEADTYRHYEYNNYYPMYPPIPTSSIAYVAEETWVTTANYNFWTPLSPMIKTQVCVNNNTMTAYINGVISGSTFDLTKLPYKP